VKRPLVNLLSMFSGDLGSRVIGFFISVYLARTLEPAGFGLMNLGLAVLGYVQLASSPGIQILETRNAAAFAKVDRERVGAVLSLRLLFAAILWIFVAGFALLFVTDSTTRDIIILFVLSVFPLALMLDWFFQAKEAFSTVAISRLLQSAIYGIVVILAVNGASDVRWAGIAFGLGALAAVVMLWSVYRSRWGRFSLAWSPAIWKDILINGLPVGAAMFLAQGVTNLPPLVIGYVTSAADVGLFSSAMKIVFLLLLVDRLFNALFLPVVTRYFSSQPNAEIANLVETTLKVVSALVVPLAVVAVILGHEVIDIAYGKNYAGATPLLTVLIGYFVLTLLNSVFVCVLIGSGHEKEYTKMVTVGSIILTLGVVAGTFFFGTYGAAYGVVCGELATVVLMKRESMKAISIPLSRILTRPLFAGVCMTTCAVLLQGIDAFVIAAVSLLVFIVMEVLLRGITPKEIQFLREKFV
jgi:O-antigen/teichoic acid export membrane protein